MAQEQLTATRAPARSAWELPCRTEVQVRIRPAGEPDLTAILHLVGTDPIAAATPGHSEVVSAEVIAAFAAIRDSQAHSLWVLEEAGEVLATYQLSLLPGLLLDGQRRGFVDAMYVHPDSRSRGFGEDLLRHAIAQARAAGCGVLMLCADKRRTAAHRFYRRMGFVASHENMQLAL